MLAEIGDARGRFLTDDALAALAGCAPSTRRSGKHHAVTFRFACDEKLREAIINCAGDSRHASPWAANIYQQARARGCRHPHAVRILARAWLHVIWRRWQDGTAYNPTEHGGHQRILIATAARHRATQTSTRADACAATTARASSRVVTSSLCRMAAMWVRTVTLAM